MTDINIPPEALEAMAREDYAVRAALASALTYTLPPWEEFDAARRAVALGHAERILRVGLKAWPGSYSLAQNDSAVIRDVAAIILPLTEKPE